MEVKAKEMEQKENSPGYLAGTTITVLIYGQVFKPPAFSLRP